MPRLVKGEQIPDFTYETPFEQDQDFLQIVALKHRTALVFLRYDGCTLCQLDIHEYMQSYDRICNAGGQLLIVLQSDPKGLAEQLKAPDAIPFRIICDPQKKLYQQFDIAPAKSKLSMAGLHTMAKADRAKKAGFTHGAYEGDELQLPAAFVMDETGKLLYVNYAAKVDEVPDTDELIQQF